MNRRVVAPQAKAKAKAQAKAKAKVKSGELNSAFRATSSASAKVQAVKVPSIFRDKVKSQSADSSEAVPRSSSRSYRGVSLPYLMFVCLSIFVAAGAMVYHLHIRFEGVRLGYEASEQRKIQTKLMLKRRELRLELASMKEPGRIEDEAREKLGMETPKSEEFIHINRKKKVVSVSGGAL